MTLEAVVFDFDGLIIDSEGVIFEAAVAAFASHGHVLLAEAWATIIGTNSSNDPDWWANLCRAAGVSDFDQSTFRAAFGSEDRSNHDELPLLPGVEALVYELAAAGVPLGVASSSNRAWLEHHLDRLDLLEPFGTLVGADVVGGVGKPAPDVYLKACSELGADPRRSVALEDSAHGVTAAKAAGMVVVAVPSRITVHNDFGHADLVVGSLTDLDVGRLRSLVASPLA